MKRTRNQYQRYFPSTIALLLLLFIVYPFDNEAAELSALQTSSVPGLSLPDLEGNMRTLEDEEFAGKVVLINFWASWCHPCIEEIPAIRQLLATMAEQKLPFAVIGINSGEAQRRVGTAVKRFGIDYTVLLDSNSSVFAEWGASVFPTAFVLDAKGQLRYKAEGPVDWDRADIVELLRELAK